MIKRSVTILSLLFLAALSYAQTFNVVYSPQDIIVNPQPGFDVDVWVDRDPSGDRVPTYEIGDPIRISVRVAQDSYIYLFSVRATGEIQQILPNRQDAQSQDNLMRAGETRTFPPQGARYTFTVGGPEGLDRVIAVASRQPLDVGTLARFETGENFATSQLGQEQFARNLAIIVQPLQQQDWVTDTALFNVVRAGQAAPAAVYGTLDIRVGPRNARAFVNNQFVGFTPVQFGAQPGTHEVRVELEGFESFTTNVNLQAGQVRAIEGSLAEVRRTGAVTFRSQPAGAEVFVDNERLGTTPITNVNFEEGTYQATFRLAGHEERRVTFTVEAGGSQTVNPTLTALRGTVTFTSQPSGAEVFVDGTRVGVTPITNRNFSAGSYQATFRLAGHQDRTVNFSVQAGTSQTVSTTLTPLRGTVTFRSQPAGAEVFVDGTRIGVTPITNRTFGTGTYQATFRLAGHEDRTVSFSVQAGTSQVVETNLRPLHGTLVINVNVGGARVFLDGQEVGVIPSPSGRLTISELPAGDHELSVTAPGYTTVIRNVEIIPGQTSTVNIRLVPR